MKTKKTKPPLLAKWLLSFFLNHSHPETMLADFEELYHEITRSKSTLVAKLGYWLQIVIIVPSFVNNSIYWSVTMFRNYFTIALRNLKKNKVYSFINIFGLAIGIACCILMLLFVHDEITYDRFHKDVDKIYGIYGFLDFGTASAVIDAQPLLGPTLPQTFPEIINAVRMTKEKLVVKYQDKLFEEKGLAVDPSFFNIFTFPLHPASHKDVLAGPHDVVLSESMATKYFGKQDPIGKSIAIQLNDEYQDFLVNGVTAKIPGNSSIQFDFLVNIEKVHGEKLLDWESGDHLPTFILLSKKDEAQSLIAKFPETIDKDFRRDFGEKSGYQLQSFADYHLKRQKTSPALVNESKSLYSYIFSGIALLVLTIACFNFTNLSIGSASTRLKEIGMRKVLGAQRNQLVRQFLFESIVLSFLALLGGILLAQLFMPAFNHLSQKTLHLELFSNGWPMLALLSLNLLVGIAAGSYPSLVLSRFPLVDLFRGKFKINRKTMLSRVLIILQFSISIFLIITTLFIYRQLNFMLEQNPGYDSDQVVLIPLNNISADVQKRSTFFFAFKNKIKQYKSIQSVSGAKYPLTTFWMAKVPDLREGSKILLSYNYVDYDFIETLGIHLQEGRNFSSEFPTDSKEAVIVNAAFVERLGLEAPVGEELSASFKQQFPGRIIGVVNDFHYESLHTSIGPAYMKLSPENNYDHVFVKIKGSEIQAAIKLLETEYNRVAPDIPFSYSFLDDQVAQQYEKEARWSQMITYASSFAIVIACSGLFGLTLLNVVNRTKEIGIRKVLGATVTNVTKLINREFVWLVVAANVVAWPVAYFVMNLFLQNYAYRIPLSFWVFILAAALALIIAIFTISFHAIKAARANPVKALRYE